MSIKKDLINLVNEMVDEEVGISTIAGLIDEITNIASENLKSISEAELEKDATKDEKAKARKELMNLLLKASELANQYY